MGKHARSLMGKRHSLGEHAGTDLSLL